MLSRNDKTRLLVLLPLLLLANPCRGQEKGFSWQPTQASSIAPAADRLFDFLLIVSTVIAGGVCFLIVAFCIKYRRGNKADRSRPPTRNLPLELTWFGIPILLSLFAFAWGAQLYYDAYQPPKNALTVYVTGKQWMWKIQHASGRREINTLHIPIGRPILLRMTSEDVIHDFYVPAFRVKQDVLPGRYTEEWFTATRPGRYHLFCAQYCGTDHSKMGGWVYAMPPDDYARWLGSGSPNTDMVAQGENLFQQYGCTGCHGPASNIHAPSLVGVYNHPVPLADRTFVIADDRYLHDSIVMPEAQIAAGYQNVMPSYKNVLTEDQVLQIVTYLRSLGSQPMDSLMPPTPVNPATQNGRGTATIPESGRAVRQASGGGVIGSSESNQIEQQRREAQQRMKQSQNGSERIGQ